MRSLYRLLLIPATVLAAAAPARAQEGIQYPRHAAPAEQPVYRCGHTYTNVPCGGREVTGRRVSKTFDSHTPPPQDRARKMARAMLPPETREKCSALEGQIRQGEARLKARAEPATPAEEGDLAIQRVHYRELHC
ncbi:MAG: hypothetical protein ACXWC2_09225 [Ramlibacter sp.]